MQSTRQPTPLSTELKPIADFLPRLKCTVQTAVAWIKSGAAKGTVKLRAEKVAGWHTTEAWVEDFVAQKTQAAMEPVPTPRTTADLKRRGAAALSQFNAKRTMKKKSK